MNVSGVAGNEAAAHTKFVNAARVNLVSREPVHLVHVELELRVFPDLLLDFVKRDLAFDLIRVFGKHTNNPITIFAGHRKESRGPVFGETSRQHVVREVPLELNVGDIEQTFQRAAFKSQAQAVAYGTLRAIARHEILRLNRLLFAACVNESARHSRPPCIIALRKVRKRCLPAHVLTVGFNKVVQQMLVLALFDDQQVRKRTFTFAERRQRHFCLRLTSFQKSNSVCNQSLVHQALCEIDLLVDLERSCLDANRFRVGRDAFSFVDDREIDSVSDQLDC
jgi:hypothetical protein